MSRSLYLSSRSPYARKVRVLLIEKNLPFEAIEVDLSARSETFSARSALGKVPLLVDGDATVFDSSVIAEYLEDRYPAPPMLGTSWSERLLHRSFDELADTLADQAIVLYLKRGDAAFQERSSSLFERALDELERRTSAGQVPGEFGLGHAAVTSAFGYVALRLGPERTLRAEASHAWLASFAARESLQATRPPAA